jgi:hypothetical protein
VTIATFPASLIRSSSPIARRHNFYHKEVERCASTWR